VIAVFALALLAPIIATLGIVFWRRYITDDEGAAVLVRPVAIGLTAGAVIGGGVAGLLLLAVLMLTRLHGR
jgi:hypothetical protein